MKSLKAVQLLLLLFLLGWDEASCLCSLDKTTAAQCHDLEDARYIETYHLHTLRAPCHSKLLSPGNFRNLTSLRHLDLSGGRIESIESGSFAKLGLLQTLNLAENRLSRLEAGAFDGLKHLHSLKLGDNAISQLPSALLSLKELRLLDLSDNPLDCNCPSLKLRDALLARGVKISKKTLCSEPASLKHASILKADTKASCLFAKQDEEMQADQPIDEGSGEAEPPENEEDENLDAAEKDLDAEEKDLEQPEVGENDAEELPASSPEPTSSVQPADLSSSLEDQQSITTISSRDDITFDDTEREATTSMPVPVPSSSDEDAPASSSSSAKPDESSGESDADLDEGSGSEGSGMIARMPSIDFGAESEEMPSSTSTSTSTTSTTEGSVLSLLNFGGVFNGFPSLFGSSETTTTTTTTTTTPAPPEKSPEEEIKEDGFIPATQEPPVAPAKASPPASSNPSSSPVDGAAVQGDPLNDLSDPERSTEPKKGVGSYIVLAALLAILVGLIGIAACKGDFCRKKRKRGDVERGTELKDMQRSLLEQNATANPAKIQANGNTLENVPLMTTCAPPEEPKDNQRSYDLGRVQQSNGNGRAARGFEPPEPVKPPRKPQEIEAPLNGLDPPMEPIDAPDRSSLPSDECSDDYDDSALTPGAQRVRITLQENPDSLPKTPILITRLKPGDDLVKAP